MTTGGKNYIPRRDDDFALWADQFTSSVAAYYENQGLDPRRLAPLMAALDGWTLAQAAHVRAQAAAEAARQAKDAARAALEQQARPIARFVQSFPATSDADRAEMGITVPTRRATRSAAPRSAPAVRVRSAGRLMHALALVDAGSGGAPPRGPECDRCEILYAIGPSDAPPPESMSAFDRVASTTVPHAQVRFSLPDAGRVVHYLARWVNSRGEAGPWSTVTSATIAA